MSVVDSEGLFQQTLLSWAECRERYQLLSSAQRRTITVHGRDYTLLHNPHRRVSAQAAVSHGTVDRLCFLCEHQRPIEQTFLAIRYELTGNSYHLAVNPYPIVSHHFTIIAEEHCRQTLTTARLQDMAWVAQRMPDYIVFFNGACAGASAPDHCHFQAVRQTDVPLLQWSAAVRESLCVQTCDVEHVKIDLTMSDMLNVLCWCDDGGQHWLVVRRKAHRPKQYYATGADHRLVSPAALEYAGLIPLARAEDYTSLTAETWEDIYSQCYDSEPLVDVGISAEPLPMTVNSDGTTTVDSVAIGSSFHWRHRRTCTYKGVILRREDADGGSWMVNRVLAEDYLTSVIASEMSTEAPMALLQAHAVISRSWLIRQMNKENTAATHSEGHVRWYDSTTHRTFDVCGDDHCQRYYGVPTEGFSRAHEAVMTTRGEVLQYGGRVIDARFAKCCGGQTEEYRYCWDDIDVPYLTSVSDCRPDGTAYCNTTDASLLTLVLRDTDRDTTDFFSWRKEYSAAELSAIVERKGHYGIGMIVAIEPVERGKSGRISRLRLVGTQGTVVIGKELEIRRVLSDTHLYSSNFVVTVKDDADGGRSFVFTGRGWGHGVGLCQIGAAVLAAEGYDYRSILEHYYKGVTVVRLW